MNMDAVKKGQLVWVPATILGGKKGEPDVPGVILDHAFSYEGNYPQCKVQVTISVEGWDGNPITSTRIHPKPIQSYRLKKRYEDDERQVRS